MDKCISINIGKKIVVLYDQVIEVRANGTHMVLGVYTRGEGAVNCKPTYVCLRQDVILIADS